MSHIENSKLYDSERERKEMEEAEKYSSLICGDLVTTCRLTRMHATYVPIDALVEALVDGFGDETIEVAEKMKEIYAKRQESQGKSN